MHSTLEAIACLKALEMAIPTWKHESPIYLIHHSDRCIQYCSTEYIGMLQRFGKAICMTQNGNPYDETQLYLYLKNRLDASPKIGRVTKLIGILELWV